MTNKFSELRANMSPAARAQSDAKAQAMLEEIQLSKLRQARASSQRMLVEVLHLNQPSIAS